MTIRTLIRLTPKTRKTITIYTDNIRDPAKLTTGKARQSAAAYYSVSD